MFNVTGQFELPYTESLPRAPRSVTSTAAADSLAAPVTREMERRVLECLKRRGAWGGTDAELQDELGLAVSSEVPRRNALMNKGLIVDSGRTRPTRTGRSATVWVAAARQR